MRKIQKKQYEDDDGRTIINMNVDGMPWYDRRHGIGQVPEHEFGQSSPHRTVMTDREYRIYTWGALKAGLLVASVFIATWVLLVLFLTKIVFR